MILVYTIMYIEWITTFHYLGDRNRKIKFKQFEIITSLNKRIYIYFLKKIYTYGYLKIPYAASYATKLKKIIQYASILKGNYVPNTFYINK